MKSRSPIGWLRVFSRTRISSRAVPSNVLFDGLVSVHSISTPSTRTKIAPVKIEIQTYESLIRLAFGECGVGGAKPPLPAAAASS